MLTHRDNALEMFTLLHLLLYGDEICTLFSSFRGGGGLLNHFIFNKKCVKSAHTIEKHHSKFPESVEMKF